MIFYGIVLSDQTIATVALFEVKTDSPQALEQFFTRSAPQPFVESGTAHSVFKIQRKTRAQTCVFCPGTRPEMKRSIRERRMREREKLGYLPKLHESLREMALMKSPNQALSTSHVPSQISHLWCNSYASFLTFLLGFTQKATANTVFKVHRKTLLPTHGFARAHNRGFLWPPKNRECDFPPRPLGFEECQPPAQQKWGDKPLRFCRQNPERRGENLENPRH